MPRHHHRDRQQQQQQQHAGESETLATHAAKQASKYSTFQTVIGVIVVGTVLLIWFLSTEGETGGRGESSHFFQRAWASTVSDDDGEEQSDGSSSSNSHQHHHSGSGSDDATASGGKNNNDKDQPPALHNNKDDASHDHHPGVNAAAKPKRGRKNGNKQQQQAATGVVSGDEPKYYYELDKPRFPDEEQFTFTPKSRGGELKEPVNDTWDTDTTKLARDLFQMFQMYDEDETSNKTLPVFGVPCVGRDCPFILKLMANLKIGIGHIIVVVNTDSAQWVTMFGEMQRAFPGRFTAFMRPDKLSCAESWNLIARMGFSIRPMVDQVFIANADWHPAPTPGVDNQMAKYAEWTREPAQRSRSLNRYFHFSSFSFTKVGFLELGYFDEVIYPALAEDVEFHIKAVSKTKWLQQVLGAAHAPNLGDLGLYPNWHSGSKHITRASQGERVIDYRGGRVARHNYILLKWGVRVPAYRDFALSQPYLTPFNLPISHNNSWVVDPNHRKCAVTGEGKFYRNSRRCYYNPEVLRVLLPMDIRATYKFHDRLMTEHDSFPHGSYH